MVEVVDPAYVKAIERLTDLGICAVVQVGLLMVIFFSLRDLSRALRELISCFVSDDALRERITRKRGT